MAVVRAIEVRRWLVRASTAGPSAVVAPTGRIVDRTPAATAAALHGAVTPRDGLTPYARMGDLFGYACVLVTLAAYGAARRSDDLGVA
jgi:apolipoprotein N-acyltransferase